MTGSPGWGAAELGARDDGRPYIEVTAPAAAVARRRHASGASPACHACGLDRCAQSVRYDKPTLVGSGHTWRSRLRLGLGLTNRQHRYAMLQANLDGADRIFADHSGPDRHAFDPADRQRKRAVHDVIRASRSRAVADQPGRAHPPTRTRAISCSCSRFSDARPACRLPGSAEITEAISPPDLHRVDGGA
jgi:hypothetical protein